MVNKKTEYHTNVDSQYVFLRETNMPSNCHSLFIKLKINKQKYKGL